MNGISLLWRHLVLNRVRDHADRFVRAVKRYTRSCERMEKTFSKGLLKITDIELIYSSSFLSVCARWETFLEEVLYDVVCGDESLLPGNRRHVTFKTRTA